jgi:hypothetical protein
MFSGNLHQRDVTIMKRAHCWHEPDLSARPPMRFQRLPEGLTSAYNLWIIFHARIA